MCLKKITAKKYLKKIDDFSDYAEAFDSFILNMNISQKYKYLDLKKCDENKMGKNKKNHKKEKPKKIKKILNYLSNVKKENDYVKLLDVLLENRNIPSEFKEELLKKYYDNQTGKNPNTELVKNSPEKSESSDTDYYCSLMKIPDSKKDSAIDTRIISLKNYLDKLSEINDLKIYVENNIHEEGFRIIKKKLDDFSQEIETVSQNIKDKIKRQIPSNMIPETAVKAVFPVISEFFMKQIIPNVCTRIKYGNKIYEELLLKINSYLKYIDIFTIDCNVQSNEYLSDEAINYFITEPAFTGNKELIGKVCDICTLPYGIRYYNSAGKSVLKYFSGSVRIYQSIDRRNFQ